LHKSSACDRFGHGKYSYKCVSVECFACFPVGKPEGIEIYLFVFLHDKGGNTGYSACIHHTFKGGIYPGFYFFSNDAAICLFGFRALAGGEKDRDNKKAVNF
jgi:hypothetical protein